jgi:hypothetical protein
MNSKIKEEIKMATGVIVQSQQKAAKVAGFTLIFATALVVISNYSVTFRYIIPGNVAETARNIIGHETAFRFNIFCNLIYLVTLIVMSASFYVILKPINKNFALVAAFTRFVYAFLWGFMAINTLMAIRLLGDTDYLSVFETDQLQTLMRLNLLNNWDAYYVGLPFWGLSSAIISLLLFKTRYIPRALVGFGFIASIWCVFCAFTFLIFPEYGNVVQLSLFDVPLTVFEVILGFWLLIKGLKPAGLVQPNLINQKIL